MMVHAAMRSASVDRLEGQPAAFRPGGGDQLARRVGIGGHELPLAAMADQPRRPRCRERGCPTPPKAPCRTASTSTPCCIAWRTLMSWRLA